MTAVVTALRLGRLGDLVMTLPALAWLARDATLQVVTSASYRSFVQWAVPDAIVLEDQAVARATPADIVLDLHGVPSSRRVARQIPRAAGAITLASKKETARRRALLIPGFRSLRPQRTWPERHLSAAAAARAHLGLAGVAPHALPALPTLSVEADPGTLGLVVDAGHPLKQWPIDRFVALARAWNGPVRVFGGPDSTEVTAEVARESHAERWVDPANTPLLALAEGLAGCGVVVAADTGPLHVAGALGVPVVGLFGPTPVHAGFWVWGARGEALSPSVSCAPCSMHGASSCRRGERVCLPELSPEVVHAAARRILAARTAA